MNTRQSFASMLIFGFAISSVYAQDLNPNTQNTQAGAQTSANAGATTQTKPTSFHIGETWQEHLQKEMNKEAAAQTQEQNQGQ